MIFLAIDIVDAEKVRTGQSLLLLIGGILAVSGLWFSMGGLRVVVSGRLDERRQSMKSLRRGIVLLLLGGLLFAGGLWLTNITGIR